MAEVIVTRPADAAERTAARLVAAGFMPLVAPLLAIVSAPPPRLTPHAFAGVVVTSAAALDAVAGHADLPDLSALPLWAVGARTAERAAACGFTMVRTAGGDAVSLVALLRAEGARERPYLYLSGEDTAADLPALLAPFGVRLERRVVYRAEIVAVLPGALATALREREPVAVLHFSARSARAYVELTAAAGLRAAALRPAQLCISAQVAAEVAATAASRIEVAAAPSEAAMLALLGRQGDLERLSSKG